MSELGTSGPLCRALYGKVSWFVKFFDRSRTRRLLSRTVLEPNVVHVQVWVILLIPLVQSEAAVSENVVLPFGM
jgi:hypothetical protein